MPATTPQRLRHRREFLRFLAASPLLAQKPDTSRLGQRLITLPLRDDLLSQRQSNILGKYSSRGGVLDVEHTPYRSCGLGRRVNNQRVHQQNTTSLNETFKGRSLNRQPVNRVVSQDAAPMRSRQHAKRAVDGFRRVEMN